MLVFEGFPRFAAQRETIQNVSSGQRGKSAIFVNVCGREALALALRLAKRRLSSILRWY
jgi:hypothetical protein